MCEPNEGHPLRCRLDVNNEATCPVKRVLGWPNNTRNGCPKQANCVNAEWVHLLEWDMMDLPDLCQGSRKPTKFAYQENTVLCQNRLPSSGYPFNKLMYTYAYSVLPACFLECSLDVKHSKHRCKTRKWCRTHVMYI